MDLWEHALRVLVMVTPSKSHLVIDYPHMKKHEQIKHKDAAEQSLPVGSSWAFGSVKRDPFGREQVKQDLSKKMKKFDRNRLDAFNGASDVGQVELGSKVAPWLSLREMAQQKASLNKHTGRYLASIHGGLESNRQRKVSELLEKL